MLPSKNEYPCQIVEMSSAEMLCSTPIKPELGAMVIVYVVELGRFEGIVERHEPTGFTISMNMPESKHKKLAEQLVWYANREVLDLPESRRHKRFVPLMQWTTVRLANGKERMARINDISSSGVNIEANVSVVKTTLLVGGHVVIGTKTATILRVFQGGFVAQFDEPFPEGGLDETIRL